MELWIEIRRPVSGGELSKRKACAEYDIHWETLDKILTPTTAAARLTPGDSS